MKLLITHLLLSACFNVSSYMCNSQLLKGNDLRLSCFILRMYRSDTQLFLLSFILLSAHPAKKQLADHSSRLEEYLGTKSDHKLTVNTANKGSKHHSRKFQQCYTETLGKALHSN